MNYQNIKTWEDACKVHNVEPTKLPEVSMLPTKFQNWLIATYKIRVITEAINTKEDGTIWIPNWNDFDQYKYFPWFEIEATDDKPSGVGFSCSYYDFWYTYSSVSSRLCFKSSDLATYAGKQFESIYKDFLTL